MSMIRLSEEELKVLDICESILLPPSETKPTDINPICEVEFQNNLYFIYVSIADLISHLKSQGIEMDRDRLLRILWSLSNLHLKWRERRDQISCMGSWFNKLSTNDS